MMRTSGTEIRTWLPKPQAATIIVAASNALHPERADYQCDGVADQVEINAALAALPAAGGSIQLTEGTYNLTASIVVNRNNVAFKGQGLSTVITVPGAHNFPVISGDGVAHSFLDISELSIDPAKVASVAGGYGLNLSGFSSVNISNLRIEDCADSGIYVAPIAGAYVADYKVVNCQIIGNRNGPGVYWDRVNYCSIVGCHINGSSLHGVQIVDSSYVDLLGVNSESNGLDGVRATGSSGISIYGALSSDRGYGIYLSNCSGCTVHASLIGTGRDTVAPHTAQVYLDGLQECIIDVAIRNSFAQAIGGITINGSAGTTMQGCYIRATIHLNTQDGDALELGWAGGAGTLRDNIIELAVHSYGAASRLVFGEDVATNIIKTIGGLENLPQERVFTYPTHNTPVEWTTAVIGAGSTVTVGALAMLVYTGNISPGQALAFLPVVGLRPGGNPAHVDFSKRLKFSFWVMRQASNADAIAYIQLKQATAHGDLAAAGIGLRVNNMALLGESYGVARGTVALGNLTDTSVHYIAIELDPLIPRIRFWVDGTVVGEQQTSNNIPQAVAAATYYLVIALDNGLTATQCFWRGGELIIKQGP